MSKALLLSVLVATVAIPLRAAGYADARRGLRALLWGFGVFVAGYVAALRFIYPHLP